MAVVVRGEDDRRRLVERDEVGQTVDPEDLGIGESRAASRMGPSMMTPRAARATGVRAQSVS
jgi:hypothetical protein